MHALLIDIPSRKVSIHLSVFTKSHVYLMFGFFSNLDIPKLLKIKTLPNWSVDFFFFCLTLFPILSFDYFSVDFSLCIQDWVSHIMGSISCFLFFEACY